MLVRTSPADTANRHAGLSQLLVDLSLPGITVNPIHILDGGHHFNEVVFDDVVVPGDMLLGEEGNGWHQVTAELAFERSGPGTIPVDISTRSTNSRGASPTRPTPPATARSAGFPPDCWRCGSCRCAIAAALDRGELPDIPAALMKDVGTTFEGDVIDEIRRVLDVPASLDAPTRSAARSPRHSCTLRATRCGAVPTRFCAGSWREGWACDE